MTKKIDLVGKRFGRLLVTSEASERSKGGDMRWVCRCDCGKVKEFFGGNLRHGASTSCGCYHSERQALLHTTHGYSKTPMINTWRGMIIRCEDKRNPAYKDYGGRGITVCKRWHKFENFLADMGERPVGLTIERKNNDKGYYKRNCKWANHSEQMINRRGISKLTVVQVRKIRRSKLPGNILAEKFGVHPMTISDVITRRTWKWV